MNHAKIRIGIIGAGKMGRLHLSRLAERTDAAVSGVFDVSEAAATSSASQIGARIYTDLDELLFESDAVVVSTSTASHFAVGSRVLSAGVHLLLEKPATGSVDTAMRLFRLAEEKGLVVKVGFLERARLLSIPVELMPTGITRIRAQRFSTSRPRDQSADIIADLMIHDIDIAGQLITADPVHVEAFENVDGTLAAEFQFFGGITASIAASYQASELSRVLSIEGDGKQLFVDFKKGIYHEMKSGIAGSLPSDAITVQFNDFLRAIAEGNAPDQHRQVRPLHWSEMVRVALSSATPPVPGKIDPLPFSIPEPQPL